MQRLIKVISLWQPWASWIMWGWKPIETRTHNRFVKLVGQTIGIHAAKRFDSEALLTSCKYITGEQIRQTLIRTPLPLGQLLGIAKVVNFRALNKHDSEEALIDCSPPPQRWGLVLGAIRPFEKPIPMTGHQGAWWAKVPEELLQFRKRTTKTFI